MLKLPIACLLLLIIVQMASGQKTRSLENGTWGGTGVALEVTSAQASIQFDCARGQTEKPLRIRKDGTFEATGTFERSGPGPIRLDSPPTTRKVTYKGKMTGKTMSLSLRDSISGEDLGSFTLTKGGEGRLHRCY